MNSLLTGGANFSETLLSALWRASWQGAIAIVAVWLLTRFTNLVSARVACWAWRLVCVKILATLVWVQPIELSVLPPVAVAASSPIAVEHAPISTFREMASDGAPPPILSQAAVVQVDAAERGFDFRALFVLLWICGACVCVATTARQWLAVRRLRTASRLPSDEIFSNWCRDEANRLNIRKPPQIYLANVEGPLLVGCLRPAIVLPERSEELFDEAELRLMLRHELAHLKRRDLLWNWLPTVVGWLLFFNPFVWLLKRGWFESQEAACDELLIQNQVARPAEYGRLLLKLSTLWPGVPPTNVAAAGVMGAFRNLERRILLMTFVRPFSRRRLFAAASALLMIALVAIIPWRLVAQENKSDAAPAEKPKITGNLYLSPPKVDDEQDRFVAPPKNGPIGAKGFAGKIYARIVVDEKKAEGDKTKLYVGEVTLDPNTGAWDKISSRALSMAVAPSGDRLALEEVAKASPANDLICDILLLDAQTPEPVKLIENGRSPLWSPDGTRIVFERTLKPTADHWRPTSTWTYDLKTKAITQLQIPDTDTVCDWTAQGDWIVTLSDRDPPFGRGYQLYVMHPDGTTQKRITELKSLNCGARFRPGTKQVAYLHQNRQGNSLELVDLDGTNRKTILRGENDGYALRDFRWSPDGKLLAVSWHKFDPDNPVTIQTPGDGPRTFARIEIIDLDGMKKGEVKLEGVSRFIEANLCDWK